MAGNNASSEAGLVCIFSLISPNQPEKSACLSAGVSSVDFHKVYWQLLAVGLHDGHVAVIDLSANFGGAAEDHKAGQLVVNRSSVLRGKRTAPITQVNDSFAVVVAAYFDKCANVLNMFISSSIQVKWAEDSADGNVRMFSISADGCFCLWLYIQSELYPTELITLPFKGDISAELQMALGSTSLAGICIS